MEAYNANGEWLTKIAAEDDINGCYHGGLQLQWPTAMLTAEAYDRDDDNNGCYHRGLQLQRTTAMVTAEACDGGVVPRAIPTGEPSLVAIRAHDTLLARAAERSAVDLP